MKTNKIIIIEKGLEVRVLTSNKKQFNPYYKFKEYEGREECIHYLSNLKGSFPFSIAFEYKDRIWTEDKQLAIKALNELIKNHDDFRFACYSNEVKENLEKIILNETN